MPPAKRTTPGPTQDQLLAHMCKLDFFTFLQEFWDTIIAETPHYNWHIKFLCDELQIIMERVIKRLPKEYDLIINVPPGSTKSTIASQALQAWAWTRDPTLRFITSSYAGPLALEHAEYNRTIVTSDKYQRLFPSVTLHKSQNAKSNFRLSNAIGQRYSTSAKGTVTGIHAHVISVDDPLNPKQAASEADLKACHAFMDTTLPSRKVDKAMTPTILIMQRLNEDDSTGHMLAKGKSNIKHICLPAELSDHVKPVEVRKFYEAQDGLLDPVRLSREVLAEAKVDSGSYGYAGQYMQCPAPEDGGIFKRAWFKVITFKKLLDMMDQNDDDEGIVWHFTADTAYTEKEVNDPTGVLAWARIGNFLVIRNCLVDWYDQPDLERELPDWCMDQGYSDKSAIIIEPKANGLPTAQNIKARSTLNIILGKPPTTDKIARSRGSSPFVETGRVLLLEGDYVEPFLDEVCTFPVAKHDERVDILNMAIDRFNTDIGTGDDWENAFT